MPVIIVIYQAIDRQLSAGMHFRPIAVDALPESLLQQFLDKAPVSARQHAINFIGQEIGAPLQGRPASRRIKAQSYWARRLAAAKASDHPDEFRAEIGSIALWVLWNVEPDWLMEQLLAIFCRLRAQRHPFGRGQALQTGHREDSFGAGEQSPCQPAHADGAAGTDAEDARRGQSEWRPEHAFIGGTGGPVLCCSHPTTFSVTMSFHRASRSRSGLP
jgi:hypothetical protein